MHYDLNDYIRRALQHRADTRAQTQSGVYTPPAEGFAHARLVGYFEVGTHEEEFEGKKRDRELVDLIFELSGPDHGPRTLDDGTKVPLRITVHEALDLAARANFAKLFAAMNQAGTAEHMAQFLGQPFIVEVFHRPSKDGKRVYANLKGWKGYNVRPPSDEEVAPAITELRAFLWSVADRDMWDSIFISGEFPERRDGEEVIAPARSKNVLQEKIMRAKNWPEHPLYKDLLAVPELSAEERAAREKARIKEQQDENWTELKRVMSRALEGAPRVAARRTKRATRS